MKEVIRRAVKQIARTPPSQRLSNLSPFQLSLVPLLSVISLFYSATLRLRHQVYDLGIFTAHRLPVPVISVGNITWGGNGKTPMVEFLARSFTVHGVSALILTRGYGGGDEVRMLQRHLHGTSTRIGVGSNRAEAAAKFVERDGYISFPNLYEKLISEEKAASMCDSYQIGLAILDDGMQHLSLMRDLEIVMINSLMPWGNHQLLPSGPLREPLDALRRADIIVIHHADLVERKEIVAIQSKILEFKESIPIFLTKMAPIHFFSLPNISEKIPLTVLKNVSVLCVSAIGLADSFVSTVEKMGPSHVDRMDFSDHHFFKPKDMQLIQQRLNVLEAKFGSKPVVVVTEKDYDRSPGILKLLKPYSLLVLCSRLRFLLGEENSEDIFKEKVMNHLLLRMEHVARNDHQREPHSRCR